MRLVDARSLEIYNSDFSRFFGLDDLLILCLDGLNDSNIRRKEISATASKKFVAINENNSDYYCNCASRNDTIFDTFFDREIPQMDVCLVEVDIWTLYVCFV